jgi:hypothetical protein
MKQKFIAAEVTRRRTEARRLRVASSGQLLSVKQPERDGKSDMG